MNGSALGFSLLFVAEVMNGSFTLPIKFTSKWAWENTWAIGTIFALFIFPPTLAYSTVPHLTSAYAQAGGRVVLLVAACGAGWGTAQVLFDWGRRDPHRSYFLGGIGAIGRGRELDSAGAFTS